MGWARFIDMTVNAEPITCEQLAEKVYWFMPLVNKWITLAAAGCS